jgi:hypothetical protein
VTPDGPTLGEVVRRLDDAVRELREMRREIADDRARFEARFLPRAEFDLAQAADAIQMRGLEGETHSVAKRLEALEVKVDGKTREVNGRVDQIEERYRAYRTLVLSAFVFPLLVMLIGGLLISGRL